MALAPSSASAHRSCSYTNRSSSTCTRSPCFSFVSANFFSAVLRPSAASSFSFSSTLVCSSRWASASASSAARTASFLDSATALSAVAFASERLTARMSRERSAAARRSPASSAAVTAALASASDWRTRSVMSMMTASSEGDSLSAREEAATGSMPWNGWTVGAAPRRVAGPADFSLKKDRKALGMAEAPPAPSSATAFVLSLAPPGEILVSLALKAWRQALPIPSSSAVFLVAFDLKALLRAF
mmetsp:Transcript_38149/g.88780  ORF Transcript_38149/g.88780 Transcript_38149/m.88780 type:complete len:244 (-) Transcript_38149:1661-2392(-)